MPNSPILCRVLLALPVAVLLALTGCAGTPYASGRLPLQQDGALAGQADRLTAMPLDLDRDGMPRGGTAAPPPSVVPGLFSSGGSLFRQVSANLPSPTLNREGPIQNLVWPSNDRVWSPDQAVLPYASFQGERVKVHNIRNCEYRTLQDYTVRHYDKTFDLRKITSVDFIIVPFAEMPDIAHTMLSFGFEGNDYLVLSVEIRKEKGEAYSPVKGFFRQYEIMYVLADERDVMWKNAIGYLCDVYVYRTKATPTQARALLLDALRRANRLRDEPEFYNTLTNNCTTNLRQHINHLAPDKVPYDYRVLLPGNSDKLAYDLGLLAGEGSFEQIKLRSRVNYPVYLYREDPQFSQKIRQWSPL